MANDDLAQLIKTLATECGSNTTYRGLPLIHLAALSNRPDLVDWLLDRGIGVETQDRRGRTPLFFAASRRMARMLMKAGADPEHRDLMQHTPLHAAVRAGRVDVAHALKLMRVDLNAQDKRGLTPLHTASVKGRTKSVEHLLRQGANPNVLDRFGRHALYYAVAGGHLDIAQSLMKGGADLEMLDDHGTPWIAMAKIDQIAPLQDLSKALLEEESAREWQPISSKPSFPRIPFFGAQGEQQLTWHTMD